MVMFLAGCPGDQQPDLHLCLVHDVNSGKCLDAEMIDRENLKFKVTQDIPLEPGMQCSHPGEAEKNLIYARDMKKQLEECQRQLSGE